MTKVLLILNAGSSSIKFSIFTLDLKLLYHGEATALLTTPTLKILNLSQQIIFNETISIHSYEAALKAVFSWILEHANLIIKAVCHRVVHGGRFTKPMLITASVLKEIERLSPLAPLHQPHAINAIKIMQTFNQTLTQIACFDTSFHQTIPALEKIFALPYALTEQGLVRYGFHGLSYQYLVTQLDRYLANKANGKIILAHLGNGASLCAIHQKQSVATTMGLTALDGVMMGTRSGSMDPGLLLYLLKETYSVSELEDILYNQSGLKGVSGLSNDVRELLISKDPRANEALDLFCLQIAKAIAALMVSLGGVDAIVFSAGIGEHATSIRANIINHLSFLNIQLDEKANQLTKNLISRKESAIAVYVIPTNEEYMMAKLSLELIPIN